MSDASLRQRALSLHESFIVQAPAGSGKTELLTQRYLTLLAAVAMPERILAVTFTKKAAAQMRSRIIAALKSAQRGKVPESEHEALTLRLAHAVLVQNQTAQWQLLENHHRLRIITIDALSSQLTARMPILSKMGVGPNVLTSPQKLYDQAVENLLVNTSETDSWYQDLMRLMQHQDNRIQTIRGLLTKLLKTRDQWLHYVVNYRNQPDIMLAHFDETLERIIIAQLESLYELTREYDSGLLMDIMRAAIENLKSINAESPLLVCEALHALPQPSLENMPYWLALRELLLTQSDEWRKAVTKKHGFLSPSESKDKAEQHKRKTLKSDYLALLDQFRDDETLQALWVELGYLPPVTLPESQQATLSALLHVLPVLVSHLRLVFQETGEIDFIELNLRAQEALGEDELNPTDIQLSLDYQIEHILIDEYQDTSVAQYQLFSKLISGWQPGDGRTLFLVGDPMQSVYRFRGAEVSLFIYTQQNGLGAVALNYIALESNFRSDYPLIEWFNNTFSQVFPAQVQMSLGAIPYAKAATHKAPTQAQAVLIYHFTQKQAQTSFIVEKIKQLKQAQPQAEVAVLVRAKRHLADLIVQLKQANVPFIAHEVDHLAQRPHIIDLITLLKATQNWADKIAWYALLRSPWLGLTLADLLVVSQQLKDKTLWSILLTYQQLEALSPDAKTRLDSVVPKLQFWLEQRGRISVSEYLRGLWIMLGGPQCYPKTPVLEDIDRVLKLVDEYDVGGYLGDIDAFEEALAKLFADIEPDDDAQDLSPVELMTIHKSKGLEFDHVFMPYLDARPPNAAQEWLNWIERTDESHIELLLATKPARNETCSYFDYLQRQIVKKETYEAARVLYVGVTRAKQQLYLTSCVSQKEDEVKAPNKGSLLSYLWPHIHQNVSTWNEHLGDVPETKTALLNRLPTQWQLPRAVIQHHQHAKSIIERWDEVAPLREDHQAKLSGIVFHRLMQWCMHADLNSESALNQIKKSCQIVLKRYGLADAELEQAVALVLKAFINMKDCPKGQWLMSPNHQDIQREWALMSFENQSLKEYIIDFSFIDENQVRWIIDFKLSGISEDNQSEHQDELLQYSKQLQTYRRLLSQKETLEVRCGLYFPLTHWWREIA